MRNSKTTRQFFHTLQTCQNLEVAIREQYPLIKNLMVYLDRDEQNEKIITVSADWEASNVSHDQVEAFIVHLPKYFK
jgi:hypothetical protein